MAVERRSRHNMLAKRKTSSRSTAVSASNSVVIDISNAYSRPDLPTTR